MNRQELKEIIGGGVIFFLAIIIPIVCMIYINKHLDRAERNTRYYCCCECEK